MNFIKKYQKLRSINYNINYFRFLYQFLKHESLKKISLLLCKISGVIYQQELTQKQIEYIEELSLSQKNHGKDYEYWKKEYTRRFMTPNPYIMGKIIPKLLYLIDKN